MSLRDDFEELCGDDFDLRATPSGVYVHERTRRVLKFYQAATERALRIVDEEWKRCAADAGKGAVLRAVEQRIKGES